MITQEQYNNYDKLTKAIERGWVKQIPNLINLTIPNMNDSLAFRKAAGEGKLKILKLLLNVSDSKALNSNALELAIKHQKTDCVEFLLPFSDVTTLLPYEELDCFLSLAALIGNPDTLKLLIPFFKKEEDFSKAMWFAMAYDYPECVNLLLEYVNLDNWGQEKLEKFSERCQLIIEAYKLQKTLEKNLSESIQIKVKSKL